jgi:membrane-bound lytic murein transglycosylase D
LALGGCSVAPPHRGTPSASPGPSASAPSGTWEDALSAAEEAYRIGLDAYNVQDFAVAEGAFNAGLDHLDTTGGTPPDDLSYRRRDLLRTKISYFQRQARERREAADELARQIEEEEVAAEGPFSDYPLEMNPRVARQIEFFRAQINGRFQLYLNRSGRYSGMIREALRQQGLPEDLVYLSLIESGFSPHAYSRSHAVGLWQFILSTGRLYDLRVDKYVDERRDPEKATIAAVRHLKDLYTSLGDWHLALAAYNCGERRVTRAIERQGTRNFWELDLPQQTEEYVPRFIAAVYIGKDPESHGFRVDYDPPIQKETVTVQRSIRLSRIAEVCGSSVQEIRDLNPSIRRDVTPPARGGFALHVPVGKGEVLMARMDDLSREPEPAVSVAAVGGTHVVRRGESLSKIAALYGTSPQRIAQANRIKTGSIIRTGQRLRIPDTGGQVASSQAEPAPTRSASGRSSPSKAPVVAGAGGVADRSVHVVRRGDTVGKIADRYGVSVADVLRWNGLSSRGRIYPGQRVVIEGGGGSGRSGGGGAPQNVASAERHYTVRRGDTLTKIAQRFSTTISEILALNDLSRNAVIRPGDRLRIPSRG